MQLYVIRHSLCPALQELHFCNRLCRMRMILMCVYVAANPDYTVSQFKLVS